MSVQKIIQEAVNRNPLSMKEALEEELFGRIRLALEAKMEEETELYENPWNQKFQKAPKHEMLPTPPRGTVPKHGIKFKEGDQVIVHTGPHAGDRHTVIHAKKGEVNLLHPDVKAKYNTPMVRAKHEHLSPYKGKMEEENELDGAKSDKPFKRGDIVKSTGDYPINAIGKISRVGEYSSTVHWRGAKNRAQVHHRFLKKANEETELDEALSPEEKKKAKEANRVAGRSASKDGDRDFYHSRFRGKKGAEKTATGVDPIKRSITMPHAMTKIGKHGHARPDSRPDKTTGKPNRLNSLHRSRNINKLVKGKLPEEAELDEVTRTAMKRAVTYTGADGHSHTKLEPVKRVSKTATGQDKIQEDYSDEIYLEAAQFLLNENIEISDLSEEQLDELLGSIVKGAAKLAYKGAKKALVNKKGNFRFSTAGKADAAQAAAQKLKKQQADRKRLEKARADLQRLRTRT